MGMCINKKVVAGLAAAGVAVFLLAPDLIGAAAPFLVLAICPLSMVVMMWAMRGGNESQTGAEGGQADIDAELATLRAELARLRRDSAVQGAVADSHARLS